MGLTTRQQRFIEVFNGNVVESARLAGYSEQYALKQAHITLGRNRIIQQAIQERERNRQEPLIATREERQKFWTSVMLDESAEMQHRLKAAELLGRSEGDFTERLQIDQDVTVTVGYLFDPRARAELLREIEEG